MRSPDDPDDPGEPEPRPVFPALDAREEAALRARFGVPEGDPTVEVGDDFETVRARIRAIEARALAALRHPARAPVDWFADAAADAGAEADAEPPLVRDPEPDRVPDDPAPEPAPTLPPRVRAVPPTPEHLDAAKHALDALVAASGDRSWRVAQLGR